MKVTMTTTSKGSTDGIQVAEYEKGKTYDVPEGLGRIFVDSGAAIEETSELLPTGSTAEHKALADMSAEIDRLAAELTAQRKAGHDASAKILQLEAESADKDRQIAELTTRVAAGGSAADPNTTQDTSTDGGTTEEQAKEGDLKAPSKNKGGK